MPEHIQTQTENALGLFADGGGYSELNEAHAVLDLIPQAKGTALAERLGAIAEHWLAVTTHQPNCQSVPCSTARAVVASAQMYR